MSKAFNATREVAACAAFTHVRTMRTAHEQAWGGALQDLPPPMQPWAAPNASNCAAFSATCFFAARDLFLELGGQTAVGVVQSAARPPRPAPRPSAPARAGARRPITTGRTLGHTRSLRGRLCGARPRVGLEAKTANTLSSKIGIMLPTF